MTSELQQNRYDQLIRRVGGIIGPGSKVAEALSELFPTIDVERVPGELLLLGGTQLGHGGSIVTGAVATAPRIQLFNPIDSSKIITCTSIVVVTGSTEVVRSTVNQTALPSGIGVELVRDGRVPIPTRPIGQIRTQLTGVLADATVQWTQAADVPFYLTDPNGLSILPPGSGYGFGLGAVNTVLQVSFWWRERVAEQAELQF